MPRDILDIPAPKADLRIPYGDDPNQFGDLRLPQQPNPQPAIQNPKSKIQNPRFPLVIYIHGGFWRARYDLTHAGHAAQGLTEAGFATWNIEYRRLGNRGGGWPGTFRDAAAAVDFVRQLAPRYNLDLGRVIVAGHSAGGHLAAWVAARHMIPPGDPLYDDSPLPVLGAVPLAGVMDLRRGWELDLSNGVVEQFIGGTPDALPHRYATASPIELLPSGVPQVLIHGADDDIVPIEISERYVEATRAKGDSARLVALPRTGHFEIVDPESEQWPQVVSAVRELAYGIS